MKYYSLCMNLFNLVFLFTIAMLVYTVMKVPDAITQTQWIVISVCTGAVLIWSAIESNAHRYDDQVDL